MLGGKKGWRIAAFGLSIGLQHGGCALCWRLDDPLSRRDKLETTKITFLGAGSTVFAKNVLGDCMLTPSLARAEFALFDIDPARLKDSAMMLETLNCNVNGSRARVIAYEPQSTSRLFLRGERHPGRRVRALHRQV